jgi:hypothetical protein
MFYSAILPIERGMTLQFTLKDDDKITLNDVLAFFGEHKFTEADNKQ